MDAEPAKQPAELNEGQPDKQGENPASSDGRAFVGYYILRTIRTRCCKWLELELGIPERL